jgi:hypothetical protein
VGTRDCRYVTATRLRRRLRALVVKIAQTASIIGRKLIRGTGQAGIAHEGCATLPDERGGMLVGSRTVRTGLSRSHIRHRGSMVVAGLPARIHGRTSRDLDRSPFRGSVSLKTPSRSGGDCMGGREAKGTSLVEHRLHGARGVGEPVRRIRPGRAAKPRYKQSHDDPRGPKRAIAGRPQRDAVGGDAGRIMDPLGRRRRQSGYPAVQRVRRNAPADRSSAHLQLIK